MEKFKVYRMDTMSNIFLIIPREDEYGDFPVSVHGMLQVVGKDCKNAFCFNTQLSDELEMANEFERLQEEAIIEYFKN